MMKLLLSCLIFLLLASMAFAQPGKNLQPSATLGLVVVQLRDFTKKPIPKAPIRISAAEGSLAYEGKTDAAGNWQCLLPIESTYWIAVGDSVKYSQVTVPNKPYSITKHTVYFQGSLNGKSMPVGVPGFNMMPPSDGQAVIDIEFEGLHGEPLVHEVVTLVADGSKKQFVDSTGANGKLQMRVPIGENYTMNLTYLAGMDHFQFPAHGGSYNVRVRYGYAGKKAIDEARAKRIADEAAYNAYLLRSKEEQLKTRDKEGHKKEFRETPISVSEPPFTVKSTNYGYALAAGRPSPVISPYFVDGLLIAGAGWASNELAAVNAETGEPVWAVRLAEGGISNVEGDDDVVVCATESCTIYAIAAKTGKLLWSKWLAGYVLSAPCIADGKLYMCYEDRIVSTLLPEIAGGKEFSMACFDLHTGEIIWQQWISGEVMSSAVADGGKLYFNTFAGYTYVLDAINGKVLAAGQLYGTSAPILVNGQLCMSQRDFNSKDHFERMGLFDASSLTLIRGTDFQVAPYLDAEAVRKTKYAASANSLSIGTGYIDVPLANVKAIGPKELVGSLSIYSTQSWEGSRPLVLNGKVYYTQGHTLRCRDAKTLAHVWEWQYPSSPNTDDGGAMMAPPIVVNGKIVVACMDGALREFNPETGRITNNYVTGEKHRQQPIAALGNFYAPCVDGKLAVVKTGNAAIDKWYCWGGNRSRNNQPIK